MPTNTTHPKIQNTPELRFVGDSVSGSSPLWEDKKLGDVFPGIKSGRDKPQAMGEYPVYGSTGIIGYSPNFSYEGDYILSARVGANAGFLNRVDGKFGVTDNTLILEGNNNDANVDFFYNLLKSKNIRSLVFGSGQPLITGGQLKNLSISAPSLSEQQKIASFLGATDEWILNLKKQKEFLESYKKGMMQKIFSQEIRFHGFNEKWEEKKLGEVGETYNGLAGKSGEDFGEGEPFITYKQIFDGSEIDISKFALVKVGSEEKQNKAQFGDVFFTTSSETPEEVGFASVLLNKDVSPYLNSFSFGFRPNSIEDLNPYFSKFFFRNYLFRKDVVKLAQGSTRYNISKVGFMKIKVFLPSTQEQQKIADFLTSVDNLIELKEKQITHAENWKKGLMQGLFV